MKGFSLGLAAMLALLVLAPDAQATARTGYDVESMGQPSPGHAGDGDASAANEERGRRKGLPAGDDCASPEAVDAGMCGPGGAAGQGALPFLRDTEAGFSPAR